MKFEEFKSNVQRWAKERGIYEHSTSEAQLMKALSELGELSDAIIKNDPHGISDGVGDVAVCLVNAAYIAQVDPDWDLIPFKNLTAVCVGELAIEIGKAIADDNSFDFDNCMSWLDDIAINNGFELAECFDQAWNDIKDRKGHMVAGGAFVKDES